MSFFTLNSLLSAQNNKADEQLIKDLLATIESGWNAKSGEKFASGFADIHDYIVVNGLYLKGLTRQKNAQVHQQLFNGPFKNTSIKLKVDQVTFYQDDLAQVTAIGAGYLLADGVSKDPTIIMTLMVKKENGNWKIISFHNHELNMEAIKKGSPMPLEVMYASWYKN